jgi:hypothetical protein
MKLSLVVLIFLFSFSASSQVYSTSDLAKNRVNVAGLNQKYPQITFKNTDKDFRDQYNRAVKRIQADVVKHLVQNGYRFERSTTVSADVYVNKSGNIEYIIYNSPSLRHKLKFEELMKEFIRTYDIKLEVDRKFRHTIVFIFDRSEF